jgi:hypothetical protein
MPAGSSAIFSIPIWSASHDASRSPTVSC